MTTVPVIGSHWEGCWLAHHDCAIKVICDLQTKVDELEAMMKTNIQDQCDTETFLEGLFSAVIGQRLGDSYGVETIEDMAIRAVSHLKGRELAG